MSAVLTTPVVATHQWASRLWVMVTLSVLFDAVSSVTGTATSPLIPKLPTGLAIVVCVNIIVMASMLSVPDRGILYRPYRCKKNRILYKLERGVPNGSAAWDPNHRRNRYGSLYAPGNLSGASKNVDDV